MTKFSVLVVGATGSIGRHAVTDQRHLVMLQGDRRWAGDPSDAVVSRTQIAQTLVASLTSGEANHKTLELVAEPGAAQDDLDPLFAALEPDPIGTLEGVLDRDNMPLDDEPSSVIAELRSIAVRSTP